MGASATPSRINTAGEVDFYRFDVSSFDEVTIETSGNSDTFMTLYGPNDATDLLVQNDDGGDNLNSKITLNLSTGTYFVSIRLYSPTLTGNYSVEVSSSAVQSSLPELMVDGAATSAAISVRNESDVYRFSVARRGRYIIETSGSTDIFLSLFSPDDQGELIEENDDGGVGLNSRIRVTLNAGEYYARVRHYSADGMGAYSIGVRRG